MSCIRNWIKKLGIVICLFVVLLSAACAPLACQQVRAASVAQDGYAITIKNDNTVRVIGTAPDTFSFEDWGQVRNVCVGALNAGAVRTNGTAVVTGNNQQGVCDVDSWKNIRMIAITIWRTFGLQVDGTIIYTGAEEREWLEDEVVEEVESWCDVVCIYASQISVAGLTRDGRVLIADPYKPELKEKTAGWKDMKSIGISTRMVVGLANDGEVLIAQDSFAQEYTQDGKIEKLEDFKGAAKVCCGQTFVAALMPDGTLRVRIIHNGTSWEEETLALDGTKDVADIFSYDDYLTVLKKDGTVLMSGYIE